MSVLIKGMEMPFTCLTCDFHKCAGGVGDFCSLTKRRQFRFKNRPKDCPLVEIPPHGDLVDRGALSVVSWREDEVVEDSFAAGALFVLDRVDELPTIIEAEECDNG